MTKYGDYRDFIPLREGAKFPDEAHNFIVPIYKQIVENSKNVEKRDQRSSRNENSYDYFGFLIHGVRKYSQ